MSVITAPIRLKSPEVTSLLPEEHYTVRTKEFATVTASGWQRVVLALAELLGHALAVLAWLLIIGVVAGLVFIVFNLADSAAASEVIQHVRTQEVPASGNTLG